MRDTAAGALTSGRAEPRILSRVEGEWGWASDVPLNCATNPHTISVTPDQKQMILRNREPVDSTGLQEARYDIVSYSGPTIRLSMHGETRRTPAGDLVLWDLVLLDPNFYAWRQTDWLPYRFTRILERCNAR